MAGSSSFGACGLLVLRSSLVVFGLLFVITAFIKWARVITLSTHNSTLVLDILDVGFLGYAAILLLLSHYNKHKKPFCSRNYSLLVLAAVSALLLELYIKLVELGLRHGFLSESGTLCFVSSWLLLILFPGITIPYTLRAFRLRRIFTHYDQQGLIQFNFNAEGLVNPQRQSFSRTYRLSGRRSFRERLTGQLDSSQPTTSKSLMLSPDTVPHYLPTTAATPSTATVPPRSVRASSNDSIQSGGSSTGGDRKTHASSGTNHHTSSSPFDLANDSVYEEVPHTPAQTPLVESRRHRAYSTRRMFLIYVGLVVLICALEGTGRIFGFSLFPFSQTPFCSPDSDSTTALTTSFLPFAGFAVVDMLLLLFDCYLVWDVWPAFNPRSEFLLALIPDVVIICAYALNWHLDTHSLVDIKVTCFFMGSLAWPLTRTFNYVYTAPPELIERHCLYDIDGILSSVVTYDAFSNYLFQQKDDVGLELLSFYVQTALFQDLQDPTTEELNQAALSLYYEFLLPDKGGVSHFFPSSVVYDIGEVLRSNDASYVDSYSRFGLRQPPARIPVHPTLFDFAQQYVLEIFAKDYFPRFQLSQIYRDLVEQAKKAHKIHTKLKAQRLLTHTVADA